MISTIKKMIQNHAKNNCSDEKIAQLKYVFFGILILAFIYLILNFLIASPWIDVMLHHHSKNFDTNHDGIFTIRDVAIFFYDRLIAPGTSLQNFLSDTRIGKFFEISTYPDTPNWATFFSFSTLGPMFLWPLLALFTVNWNTPKDSVVHISALLIINLRDTICILYGVIIVSSLASVIW